MGPTWLIWRRETENRNPPAQNKTKLLFVFYALRGRHSNATRILYNRDTSPPSRRPNRGPRSRPAGSKRGGSHCLYDRHVYCALGLFLSFFYYKAVCGTGEEKTKEEENIENCLWSVIYRQQYKRGGRERERDFWRESSVVDSVGVEHLGFRLVSFTGWSDQSVAGELVWIFNHCIWIEQKLWYVIQYTIRIDRIGVELLS